MADNTLLTPTAITREALRVLHSEMPFIRGLNRQYDSQFAKTGAKIGQNLTIRMPNKFPVRTGKTMQTNIVSEASQILTVATQKGVDMDFSAIELTLTIDEFSKRYLQPAMSRLAAEIESDVLTSVLPLINARVGTAGTNFTDIATPLAAQQKLNEQLAPRMGRNIILTPGAEASGVKAMSGLFNPNGKVSDAFNNAMVPSGSLGFKNWNMSQLTPSILFGSTTDTTPIVNGAVSSGSTLVLSGCTASGTLKAGQTFTVVGCYEVNPETGTAYGDLKQFVITADATATGGGAHTISFAPAIVITGVNKNCSAAMANGVAVSFLQTGAINTNYGLSLAFQEDFMTFVSADLELPTDAHFAAREVFDGISMRIWRASEIINDQFPCRIDVLYGKKVLRDNHAVLIYGK
jgi:hypothetical protein